MKRYAEAVVNMALAAFFGWLLWRVTHRWELWVAGYLGYIHLAGISQNIRPCGHPPVASHLVSPPKAPREHPCTSSSAGLN